MYIHIYVCVNPKLKQVGVARRGDSRARAPPALLHPTLPTPQTPNPRQIGAPNSLPAGRRTVSPCHVLNTRRFALSRPQYTQNLKPQTENRWVSHDEAKRAPALLPLLSTVRLGLLPLHTLASKVPSANTHPFAPWNTVSSIDAHRFAMSRPQTRVVLRCRVLEHAPFRAAPAPLDRPPRPFAPSRPRIQVKHIPFRPKEHCLVHEHTLFRRVTSAKAHCFALSLSQTRSVSPWPVRGNTLFHPVSHVSRPVLACLVRAA